ncbi:hypothetical protein JTB14_021488 [Gonioctena quinquepunctata]|nr:hypothetical protein JTB14_021488 [Gonioctena quinquepunctata]
MNHVHIQTVALDYEADVQGDPVQLVIGINAMENNVSRMENDAIKKDKELLSLKKENDVVKMDNELLLHINSNFEKEMSNLIDRNQELFDLLKSKKKAYCQLERKPNRLANKVSIDKEIQKENTVTDVAAEYKDCEKSAAEPSDNSFQVPCIPAVIVASGYKNIVSKANVKNKVLIIGDQLASGVTAALGKGTSDTSSCNVNNHANLKKALGILLPLSKISNLIIIGQKVAPEDNRLVGNIAEIYLVSPITDYEKKRCSNWLQAIGRAPEENLSPHNVICSKHFEENDLKLLNDTLFLPCEGDLLENVCDRQPTEGLSSTDSAGLKGSPKRDRKLIKKITPICVHSRRYKEANERPQTKNYILTV